MAKNRGTDLFVAWVGRVLDPMRILIGNRSLSLLVLAFGGVTVAEWGYVTALAIYAFRSHGAAAVGIVGFRLFFAAVGVMFCVPYVVRRRASRVLSTVAAARAGIVGLTCFLAATKAPLALLLVLVALDAVVSAPYRPAQAALLPALARTPQELAATAAALSTVKTLSQAAGAAAGGLLLVVISTADVFAGAAVLFLAAAVVTSRFIPASVSTSPSPPASAGTVLRDALQLIRQRHIRDIVLVSGLRTLVRGMWLAIAVIASLKLLHAGSAGVGLLMLAAGIGSLVAVPLSATLIGRSRLGTPTAAALILCGVPIGIIAGVPVLDVAVVLIAAWGIGMAVADVSLLSLLYRLMNVPTLPRAIAVMESLKLALEGIGALIAPLLASTIGIRGALVAAAAPLPIVVIADWRALNRVDEVAGRRTEVIELFHHLPLFEPLDVAALELLASRAARLSVPAGTEVVRQGDRGDRFYAIEQGSADVLIDGFYVGEVGVGDGFGEKALLREVPRTATVRAREPMRLYALAREDFLGALIGVEQRATIADPMSPRGTSTEWDRRARQEVLSRVSLFSHLPSDALADLAAKAVVERWPAGDSLIREGDLGDRFFVLLDGRATVSSNGEHLSELRPGDQFGEIALLHNVPRRADVTASSPLITLSIHRDDFVSALRSRAVLG